MSFVDFLISKGYIPFRKIFDLKTKKWVYVGEHELKNYCITTDNNFFSTMCEGCIDIRLIKDEKEIVFGIPGIIVSDKNSKVYKTHYPSLIYPNVYGNIFNTDEMFEKVINNEITYDIIYNDIEKWFKINN